MDSTGDSAHLAGVLNPGDSLKPIAMVPSPQESSLDIVLHIKSARAFIRNNLSSLTIKKIGIDLKAKGSSY
ncbi:hypothetical protein IFR05_010536 [Cadophora sp. M221]|nr:hypothetical protein IFR05_010536 [Cadophora sp. M221]